MFFQDRDIFIISGDIDRDVFLRLSDLLAGIKARK